MNNRKHKFFNVKHHHQPLEKKCFHKYLRCECFRMNKNIFLRNFFWKELLAKQILSHIHSFKGSMLDEMTWRNSSEYVVFHICKNTKVVLSIYYFVLWLLFSLLNILVYDQEKNSTKWKKQLCVFIYIYNIWQIINIINFAGSITSNINLLYFWRVCITTFSFDFLPIFREKEENLVGFDS